MHCLFVGLASIHPVTPVWLLDFGLLHDAAVGVFVGAGEGASEGYMVGELVGLAEGAFEGYTVGEIVG